MKTIFLWGDSLSAEREEADRLESWPKMLEKFWSVNMQVQARGGLPMNGFKVPMWATAATPSKREPNVLCVFLGANDGIKDLGLNDFRVYFKQILDDMTMLQQDAKAVGDTLELWVIMLPRYQWSTILKAKMSPYWKAQKLLLDQYDNVNRTEMPWDAGQMEDTYHPNAVQHLFWSCHMAELWELPKIET